MCSMLGQVAGSGPEHEAALVIEDSCRNSAQTRSSNQGKTQYGMSSQEAMIMEA